MSASLFVCYFGRDYTSMVVMKQMLYIVRGVPGSGKSYLSNRLRKAIGVDNVVVLDPDAIDKESQTYKDFAAELQRDGVDEKFYPFRFLRAQAFDAITAGKSVIWNQAFNDFNGMTVTISRLLEFADQQSITLPVLIIEVTIDKAVARQRIAGRAASGGHDVPDDKLDQFFAGYESFADRGYRTIIVDGNQDASISVKSILD